MGIELAREALLLAVVVVGPVAGVALLVGVTIGFLQAVTQVQDPTISAVPRIVAVVVALVALLPWMLGRLLDFAAQVIRDIPSTL